MLPRGKRSNKSKPAFNILDHLHVYFMNSRYAVYTRISKPENASVKIELITVMVLGLTENTQVSIAVYFMTNVSEYLTCMDMDIWAMFTTASKSSWKVYSTH